MALNPCGHLDSVKCDCHIREYEDLHHKNVREMADKLMRQALEKRMRKQYREKILEDFASHPWYIRSFMRIYLWIKVS